MCPECGSTKLDYDEECEGYDCLNCGAFVDEDEIEEP